MEVLPVGFHLDLPIPWILKQCLPGFYPPWQRVCFVSSSSVFLEIAVLLLWRSSYLPAIRWAEIQMSLYCNYQTPPPPNPSPHQCPPMVWSACLSRSKLWATPLTFSTKESIDRQWHCCRERRAQVCTPALSFTGVHPCASLSLPCTLASSLAKCNHWCQPLPVAANSTWGRMKGSGAKLAVCKFLLTLPKSSETSALVVQCSNTMSLAGNSETG